MADTPEHASLGISEAARQSGVSERTLRFYEEIGLLSPASRSPAGTRRYGAAELERVVRIRDLQDLVGLDLDTIKRLLASEDRALRLVAEAVDVDPVEHRRLLEGEIAEFEAMFDRVRERADRVTVLLGELRNKTAVFRDLLAKLD